MGITKIAPEIYSVGVIDWDMRTFHGRTYTTKRGTTYNAYLIIDEKITLVDTVYGPFSQELIANIEQIVPVGKIDYIIANHVETDHSGALPALMKLCPRAKVYGTQKCKEGLYKHYYGDWDFTTVKTGDTLKLGRRTLTFVEAPMIHWPDSMLTYCPEEKLLFSNDAFGQHLATSERFDDEVDPCVLMDEALKYYANILWPLSPIILKKLQDISKMGISLGMIAPSHGLIWRRDPAKIVNAYTGWAQNPVQPKIVVAYETMWGTTAKMARRIADGIADAGVSVKVFDIALTDRTELVTEIFESKGILLGSSTHDNDLLPTMAGFLDFLKGLKPRGRIAAAFGSHGWAGGAVPSIERIIKEAGIEIAFPGIAIKYVPDANELTRCYDLGKEFAGKIAGKV
ncbi:MAG: flavodoxin domain-containing protein [Candidatus Omnitrophota bacterium]